MQRTGDATVRGAAERARRGEGASGLRARLLGAGGAASLDVVVDLGDGCRARGRAGEPLDGGLNALLAELAIVLETPTSRLVSESGRAGDAEPGELGRRAGALRSQRQRNPSEIAEAVGLTQDDYEATESGSSPLETVAPRLLAFAELVDVPVFNLFYPCGLKLEELDDYP